MERGTAPTLTSPTTWCEPAPHRPDATTGAPSLHRRRDASAPGGVWEAVSGSTSNVNATGLAVGANAVAGFVKSPGAYYLLDDNHSDWSKVSDTPALARIAVGPDGFP